MGHRSRKRKRHGAIVKTGDTTTQPRAGSPADLQSAELTEETETLSPEPKKEEKFTEDTEDTEDAEAEAEAETKAITPQTPLTPNKALPSFGAQAGILECDRKLPVVLLKPVFTPLQGYCCQVCSENFPTVSQFLIHEQLHQGKAQDAESCKQPFTSSADFNEHQQVQEPSFPCNICDRSFASRHHLKRHKLLHVKDGRKCQTCGVLFCQRHNHVLYLPQTECVVEPDKDSSNMEPEMLESLESNQISDTKEKAQGTKTVTSLPTTSPKNTPSSTKHPRPLSKTGNPLPPLSHTNVMTCIPLPVFKKLSNPTYQVTKYSKCSGTLAEFMNHQPCNSDVSQPRFPHDMELPPSLNMFSPKFLTSPFFEVTRNYDYILSKQSSVEPKIKEENWEVPLISLEGQSIKTESEESLSFLDVVF